MASNSSPKLDLQWLKDNAVSITKNKWYLLKDHRIAVFVDKKVKFTGRWEDEGIFAPVKKKTNERAFAGQDYETIRAEYYDVVYSTVLEYMESSDRATAYKAQMNANVVNAFTPTVEIGYEDGGSELPLDDDVNDFLNSAQASEIANVSSLFVSLKMLRDAGETDPESEATARADGYIATLDGIYNKAVCYGAGNKMLTFAGDDGEHSCESCTGLKGQRHKASWWISHDYVPPTGSGLDCAKGGKCMHILEDDEGNQVTI